MSEIIFARPRHEFGSYQDLWQLITLSGFPLVFYDEMETDSSNTYILTIRNEDAERGFSGAKARLILFDMEYRREPQSLIPGISDYFHMDKWQAELTGSKYVPIGGHPGLRLTDTPTEPTYDVAYLAYMTHRRQRVYNDLQARGVRLSPTSAWGAERNAILSSSSIYLHVHQHDDIPAVPGLRLVVAAAYKLPIISEAVYDAGVYSKYVHFTPYSNFANAIREDLSGDYFGWEVPDVTGERLHKFLCVDYTFRMSIEAAL